MQPLCLPFVVYVHTYATHKFIPLYYSARFFFFFFFFFLQGMLRHPICQVGNRLPVPVFSFLVVAVVVAVVRSSVSFPSFSFLKYNP